MSTYRVSFYKDLCNSDGHSFKCLQRQLDVQSDGRYQALLFLAEGLAKGLVDNELLNADGIEVMHLTADHDFKHSSAPSPAPCTHT